VDTGTLEDALAICKYLTSKILEDPVSNPSTTTLSSKGQVVIPEEIRDRLGLVPGTRFVVVAERDVVVFKVLKAPEADEFAGLVTQARAVARDDGLRVADVRRAVRAARRKA
jgi:AbrB family looped-hinge helix DNA binding protein